ncbi:protein E2A [Proboscivirus elephantidbeta4]|uniref:Protein E2A n=1 Tax=Elephant endotheliotropic herpesvirus 4 TaxID=548914 RepID=A0A0S1TPM4_9BETA|nr:protein E2A [Elephant endotheliotropic herpesvirus 4]ALM25928.1 protein E2A [Elephant endotheliotropic herpesvirus 4]
MFSTSATLCILLLFLTGSNSANNTSTTAFTATSTNVSTSQPSTSTLTSTSANGSSAPTSVSTRTGSNSSSPPPTSPTTATTGGNHSRGVSGHPSGGYPSALASHSKQSTAVPGAQPATRMATNHSNQVLDGLTFVLNTVALAALVPVLLFHMHYFNTAHRKCPYNIIMVQEIMLLGCILLCCLVYASFFWQYSVLYLAPACFVLLYGCMAVAAFNLILAGNFTIVLGTGKILAVTSALLLTYALMLFYLMYTDDRPSTLFVPSFEPLCPAKTEHFFLTYAYVQYLLFIAFTLSAFAFGCTPGNMHVLPLFAALSCNVWIWFTYWCGGRNIVLGVFVANVYAVLLLYFLPETLYLYRKYRHLADTTSSAHTRPPIVINNRGFSASSPHNHKNNHHSTPKKNNESSSHSSNTVTKTPMMYSTSKCNFV